ncbi:uncharacterized protein N7483_012725 [Penicillium malachiteum]|uniref:uncharacterized protein n=1 Tax=Penicillium malachiteum TaxID=1324776 RepID=UPI0025482625|nr:uncharacterized protein N7483_012725 [Penicillium malachiteum]KAJ5715544.1 hypothetical protein N7483_012725 [Penicillium malachiteum]
MKPSTAAIFPTLPVELIELIAESVESVDSDSLLDLRLVCRDLQKKTFNHFARRFFSSIRTDLSEESLSRINALSRHEELRPHVQGLAFMLQNGIGRGLVWNRHSWGSLSSPMEIEQIRRLRDNLVNNLINCRSFFIVCRYPEGHPDLNRVTVTDAVAVFFALVVDSQLPVSSFHLVYANRSSRTLMMDMRRVPKLLYRQPKFHMVWSNLQKLSLEQYLTLDNFGFLLELVLCAPNLKTLLLNLGSHDLAAEFMHELAETVSFTQLEELALFRTALRAKDLMKLLTSAQDTLKILTFYRISVLQEDNWSSVLKSLSQGFVNLTAISLYYLWSNFPKGELLSFPGLEKSPVICQTPDQRLHIFYTESQKTQTALGVEYSGSNMSQVLSLLQTTTVYLYDTAT